MFTQKYSVSIELGPVFAARFKMKMFRTNRSPVTCPRRENLSSGLGFQKSMDDDKDEAQRPQQTLLAKISELVKFFVAKKYVYSVNMSLQPCLFIFISEN